MPFSSKKIEWTVVLGLCASIVLDSSLIIPRQLTMITALASEVFKVTPSVSSKAV